MSVLKQHLYRQEHQYLNWRTTDNICIPTIATRPQPHGNNSQPSFESQVIVCFDGQPKQLSPQIGVWSLERALLSVEHLGSNQKNEQYFHFPFPHNIVRCYPEASAGTAPTLHVY